MSTPEEERVPTADAASLPEDWILEPVENGAEAKQRKILRPGSRPGLVTLIALFQFAKAGFLLIVVALIWKFPDMRFGSLAFWEMAYVASNGGGKPGLLTPLVATYTAVIGWGLWNLKRWARSLLMVSSGITAFLWIRYFAVNSIFTGTEVARHIRSLRPGFEQESVHLLVALDAMLFLCLAFHPDVIDAFGGKA